ncbi:MAG TPA: hypothetical protein VFH48_15740 [Chloroflexota bacterium]|nr:hypothetical protein [Chloroflexota bacterium]
MNAGTLIFLVVMVAIIALVAYMAMSQSEIPTRVRRLLKQKVDDRGDETPRRGPRPRPSWNADPDRTNEAAEVEKVTGVIRSGEAFTIATTDPSFWESRGFDVEGLIVQVAEVQTIDVSGNFQFRYCVVEASGASANTIIIEGDSPTASVAYLARALMPDDMIGEMRAGQVIENLRRAREEYRRSGQAELPISMPPYENATVIAARYEGRLALLESEPGKGYLPVSAANPDGVAYADLTVRLESPGWLVRLVEVGAYVFLLEIEQIRLADLTVHHIA